VSLFRRESVRFRERRRGRVEDFYCDVAVVSDILGDVDGRDAAGAELTLYFVAAGEGSAEAGDVVVHQLQILRESHCRREGPMGLQTCQPANGREDAGTINDSEQAASRPGPVIRRSNRWRRVLPLNAWKSRYRAVVSPLDIDITVWYH
jgi:hypothetical protein